MLTVYESQYLQGVIKSINAIEIRHCDIKPANIVQDTEGRLFIIYFSIADTRKVWKKQDAMDLEDMYNKNFVYGKYGFT